MRPRVYIETTIPSYLTAWPSRNPALAADQQLTRDWWAARDRYELFVSGIVHEECEKGDSAAAADRLAAIRGIPILPRGPTVDELADDLIRSVPIPPKASRDAFHIAAAAVGRVEYLVTWNCTHLANPALRGRVEAVCRARGVAAPVICTPRELMEAADGTGTDAG